MAIIKTIKDGEFTAYIHDDCIVSPEEQEEILRDISHFMYAHLAQKAANEAKGR